MKKKLGTPQRILYNKYIDCKKRTKKQIDFPYVVDRRTYDEELVLFLLGNSSITERDGERSFHHVCNAINLMCRQLCPGEWCSRSHCKYHTSGAAYNCQKTRPAACKEYSEYIKGKEERIRKNKEQNDPTH